MGQVSRKLRRYETGYAHWCPACEEMHVLPDGWSFNSDLEEPTFLPSFLHSGYSAKHDNFVCHYILTAGVLHFQGDCTLEFRGKSVPRPLMPIELTDSTEGKPK